MNKVFILFEARDDLNLYVKICFAKIILLDIWSMEAPVELLYSLKYFIFREEQFKFSINESRVKGRKTNSVNYIGVKLNYTKLILHEKRHCNLLHSSCIHIFLFAF
jgi:hypothetical protein